MKKLLLLGLSIFSFSLLQAQTSVDVSTGAEYANDVYYSMENGEVSSAARNTWDIAFVTKQMDISILVNKGSYLNDGIGVELFTYPNGDISAWSSMDTSGIDGWKDMYNSPESFSYGAFTMNADTSNEFDFGWGIYNVGNHHIVGDSLYVIKTLSGAYKKLWIVEKAAMANTWEFKYANLDGSDEQTVNFSGNDYSTKNFIYYSIDNNQFIDREPAAEDWELLFTNWGVLLNYGGTPWPQGLSGVMTNELQDVTTQEISHSGVDQATEEGYNDTLFVANPSNIGSDWKKLNFQTMQYELSDTTVYFIKKKAEREAEPGRIDSTYWKMYFTGFGASVDGKYTFTQKKLHTTVSVEQEHSILMLDVFPNPATEFVTLVYDAKEAADIHIFDISGKLVYSDQIIQPGFSNHRIDVSSFSEGTYFVRMHSNGESSTLKFIKQ